MLFYHKLLCYYLRKIYLKGIFVQAFLFIRLNFDKIFSTFFVDQYSNRSHKIADLQLIISLAAFACKPYQIIVSLGFFSLGFFSLGFSSLGFSSIELSVSK